MDIVYLRRLSDMLRKPIVVAGLLLAGCTPRGSEVVVYSALDQEFAAPVLARFERETNIHVRPKWDVESTKTVALVSRILNERHPMCDLFWNNEILHTIRLERRGMLESVAMPRPDQFPLAYRDEDNRWFGLAARARVLIVNTDRVAREDWPTSIHDLTDESWRQQVGIAKPLFGTTATHAAVLFATWGETQALDYFRRVRQNSMVLSGNKQVATDVGRGRLAFGLTDTDDAIVERDNGRPVAIVFPDQDPSGMGALFIPNTVCLIKNGPNPNQARQLLEFLLSPAVEAELAAGRSAQFPINPQVAARSRVLSEQDVKWMDVDFAAAADKWESAIRLLRDEFSQ